MTQATLSGEIIEEIEKGDTSQQITQKFSWASLSFTDKEEIVRYISVSKDSDKVEKLLRYVHYSSKEVDIPICTRALISAFSNPLLKKMNLEKICSSFLNKWGDQTKDSNPEGVIQYLFCLADFHGIQAKFSCDDGKLQQAKSSYQKALGTYNKIGIQDDTLTEKKRVVQKYIEQIESLISENMQIGSIDSLRNERLELLADVRNQKDLSEKIKKEYESLQTKIKEGEHVISQIKSEFATQNKKLKSLQEKIKVNESAVHFLVALPQLTMSPLWVEVIRLALDKGEIDEFTKKCIEALRASYPKYAIPLLVEIAVRTQTTIPISSEAAQFGLGKFSALMEEARSLEATDEIQAAKKLVEAWDVFYSISKSTGEDR